MVKEVPLTQGKVSLVDDADFDMVMQFKWHLHKAKRDDGEYLVYACRRVVLGRINGRLSRKTLFMHVFLCPELKRIDHKDGDGLNNQRMNLRLATPSQNAANRHHKRQGCYSNYIGVSWNRLLQMWSAYIRVNGRSKHLGFFEEEWAAAHAYDLAAIEHFGEFASPNLVSA